MNDDNINKDTESDEITPNDFVNLTNENQQEDSEEEFIPNDFIGPIDDVEPNDTNYVEIIETTIEDLKLEIDNIRHDAMNDEELVNKIIQMKESLENKLSTLEDTNASMREQIEELLVKLQKCDDEIIEHKVEALSNLDLKLKLEDDINNLTIQIQQLHTDKVELTDQVGFLNDELETLRSTNVEINLKIKEHDNKMYNMNQRLLNTHKTLLQLCSEVEILRQKRTTLWNSVWEYFY